jgi:hypothetical protein
LPLCLEEFLGENLSHFLIILRRLYYLPRLKRSRDSVSGRTFNTDVTFAIPGFRHSSGMVSEVCSLLVMDVSGEPIGPVFWERLSLVDGADMLS